MSNLMNDDEKEWRPPFLLSQYKDIDTRDNRCAVAILFPSGVHDNIHGISVDIENSRVLRVSVLWPTSMSDVRIMLRNFLDGTGVQRIDRSDPMIGGFNDALREFQPELDGKKESVTRISLPFPVNPDPARWLCTYEGSSTKILLVKMEGPSARVIKSNELTTLIATRTRGSSVEANSGSVI